MIRRTIAKGPYPTICQGCMMENDQNGEEGAEIVERVGACAWTRCHVE
jgi:hypothetical protein